SPTPTLLDLLGQVNNPMRRETARQLGALQALFRTDQSRIPKRNVFISFHQGDRAAVDEFVDRWAYREGVFTPKALGVSTNDDFINSGNPEYVMSKIREKYLGDSTVTIVLMGVCTHSRRYVDWEIKTSLRRGDNYTANGLLG